MTIPAQAAATAIDACLKALLVAKNDPLVIRAAKELGYLKDTLAGKTDIEEHNEVSFLTGFVFWVAQAVAHVRKHYTSTKITLDFDDAALGITDGAGGKPLQTLIFLLSHELMATEKGTANYPKMGVLHVYEISYLLADMLDSNSVFKGFQGTTVQDMLKQLVVQGLVLYPLLQKLKADTALRGRYQTEPLQHTLLRWFAPETPAATTNPFAKAPTTTTTNITRTASDDAKHLPWAAYAERHKTFNRTVRRIYDTALADYDDRSGKLRFKFTQSREMKELENLFTQYNKVDVDLKRTGTHHADSHVAGQQFDALTGESLHHLSILLSGLFSLREAAPQDKVSHWIISEAIAQLCNLIFPACSSLFERVIKRLFLLCHTEEFQRGHFDQGIKNLILQIFSACPYVLETFSGQALQHFQIKDHTADTAYALIALQDLMDLENNTTFCSLLLTKTDLIETVKTKMSSSTSAAGPASAPLASTPQTAMVLGNASSCFTVNLPHPSLPNCLLDPDGGAGPAAAAAAT